MTDTTLLAAGALMLAGGALVLLLTLRRLARWHAPRPVVAEWDAHLYVNPSLKATRERAGAPMTSRVRQGQPTFKRGGIARVRQFRRTRKEMGA